MHFVLNDKIRDGIEDRYTAYALLVFSHELFELGVIMGIYYHYRAKPLDRFYYIEMFNGAEGEFTEVPMNFIDVNTTTEANPVSLED
jgi:hypothetical protein